MYSYVKQRRIITWLFCAFGLCAALGALLLWGKDVALVLSTTALYFLGVLSARFSYELAWGENRRHTRWHTRNGGDTEPSDFLIYSNRLGGYGLMLLGYVLLLCLPS